MVCACRSLQKKIKIKISFWEMELMLILCQTIFCQFYDTTGQSKIIEKKISLNDAGTTKVSNVDRWCFFLKHVITLEKPSSSQWNMLNRCMETLSRSANSWR